MTRYFPNGSFSLDFPTTMDIYWASIGHERGAIMDISNLDIPADRDASGRFLPGRSGNPAGKKPGTRNRTTEIRAMLAEGDEMAEARFREPDEIAAADIQPEPSPSGRGQGEGLGDTCDGDGSDASNSPHPNPLPEGEGIAAADTRTEPSPPGRGQGEGADVTDGFDGAGSRRDPHPSPPELLSQGPEGAGIEGGEGIAAREPAAGD